MTHRDVQSTLWNGIGPRGESQWGRRRRRRSNVHGSPTAQERLCFCLTRGVSNTRALEFESALERDTSMNSRLRDEGWIRVNNRESKWGDHHLSRSRRHSSTRGCHRDAWGIRRRSCYGMELCLRIENILKGSRKWFTRDKSRSVTCSSEVGKRSLCRLVWEVRWMKSRAHGIQCGTADSSGSSSVGSSHTMAGRKIWWMQNTRSLARSIITWAIQCQWRGSQQYYMLVKMFSVQALETVRSSPEGVNAEVWRKQARNTNLALVSDMTWYLDLCWKDDLVNMMSGTWVVRSTRSERRGCHRVSSEVFFVNNGPVKNLNKELCGLVRCFQVASKTSPGSRSPEVSSVRQSRVEPRAWRNSTKNTSGDCQGARCCAKRLSIPSWTRRAWKDPNAMQGMQCMWSPVRKDKAMTKRWSPVTVWQLLLLLLLRWLLRLLSLRFGPMWLAARAPLAPPPFSLPLKDFNPAPSNNLASIWHSQKYRTRVSAQFRFYTHINMVFTSYLIYIVFMYLNLI